MSGVFWGLVGSEIWRPFHKNEKILKNSIFGGPAEFPYLGIISQYQVFLHNEPISAWECNIYIIYESWVRKISCDSRYARKLDFSYYAKIWKFGPRHPENEFFRKFLIFMERSQNFASNEPSTTPDIKFKSSYARKHDYAQIWKFHIWNFHSWIIFNFSTPSGGVTSPSLMGVYSHILCRF